MNEMPSQKMKEMVGSEKRRLRKETRAREKATRSVHLGSLPPHLSDPSHSPVSEDPHRNLVIALAKAEKQKEWYGVDGKGKQKKQYNLFFR
ncbi:hypothetical protein JCGZ_14865 [Jatropha curcas]|uniref:Uncharacterized protein n=1 Tax=Jatropha curcas TaxID=180498 RepID=A0A067K8V4_JATCU|nr:hypothetical protein JCGZ_14865 [Jatropha curcas]